MKKSLIALAALAAVSAASAQSTVTLSGNLDVGYRSVNAPAASKDTNGVLQSGTSTTAIFLKGSEDLGGGLKANFQYEFQPDLVGGGGFSGVTQTLVNGQQTDTGFTGAQGQHFVSLSSGNFGEVKFGRPNTGLLSTWGVASVFGTALGSGWSSSQQFVRYGSTASTAFNTAPSRFNNSVEYTSPVISGFTGRILYAPKVNEVGGASTDVAAAAILAGSAPGTSTAGVNRPGATDLSLAYSNGPLNVSVAQQRISVGSNGVNTLVGYGPSVANAGSTSKVTMLAANYTIGAYKVLGGTWTEKQDLTSTTNVNVTGYMIGGMYTMGAIDLLASYASSNDKSLTTNLDRNIFGLGANYNLSKRSALWARYENRDANTNSSADDTANGKTKTMAAGVRHQF